ncbi:MAG: DUF3458 domain-containing protein, partial [Xanthomonadales bacterium]|nr:DUF3458 domain-containing protein [Xanthomonadales bacterium]
LTVVGSYDASKKRFTLDFMQRTPPTPDQEKKQPLVIPVSVGLITRNGEELALQLAGKGVSPGTSLTLVVEEQHQSFVFEGIDEAPIPSLLRGYSAPVKLDYSYSSSDLAVLMAHDSDDFVRWEAGQLLAQREILANVRRFAEGSEPSLQPELIEAFQALLSDTDSDPALVAEALTMPGEDYLGAQMQVVDVDGIHAARKFVKSGLAETLLKAFTERYISLASSGPYSKSSSAMARRSLRNVCLSFLLETDTGIELALAQLDSSDNMTDSLAALQGLVWAGAPAADAALRAFEVKWKDDALVMDKWFAIQAAIPGKRSVERVRALLVHPGFSIANPNKVRSLIGVFSMMNPTGFHSPDGSGYRLHADQIIALDALNPQMAARMAGAFNPWTRFDEHRRDLMRAELRRIAAVENLSGDVAEIINSAIGMEKTVGVS